MSITIPIKAVSYQNILCNYIHDDDSVLLFYFTLTFMLQLPITAFALSFRLKQDKCIKLYSHYVTKPEAGYHFS
jgi:hypothetical protein